jgi:hypothetical protein
MKGNIFRFRTVKWGDPARKLKMLPDDIGLPRWRVWLKRYWEYGAVAIALAAGFAIGVHLFW